MQFGTQKWKDLLGSIIIWVGINHEKLLFLKINIYFLPEDTLGIAAVLLGGTISCRQYICCSVAIAIFYFLYLLYNNTFHIVLFLNEDVSNGETQYMGCVFKASVEGKNYRLYILPKAICRFNETPWKSW